MASPGNPTTVKQTDVLKPPHKKQKTDASRAAEVSAQQDAAPLYTSAERTMQQSSTANVDLVQSSISTPELDRLEKKYTVATMSIISSVKIEQKVRSLLSHLAHFNYTDIHCKPGVVALHAKANVAGKMISIVEIAKREIQDEKGCWWQYSSCHGELREWKQKGAEAKNNEAITAGDVSNTGHTQGLRSSREDGVDLDEADGEEEAFQAILPEQAAAQVEARKKVRAVPIMTIYMSRVPIPELKAIYGYDESYLGASLLTMDSGNRPTTKKRLSMSVNDPEAAEYSSLQTAVAFDFHTRDLPTVLLTCCAGYP